MIDQRFRVDKDLLQSHIDELGNIGLDSDSGVLFRPVYSAAWLEARDMLEKWMLSAGLTTRVDSAGNLFGRLDGHLDGPVVLSGSHLDTVRNGGKYDGALGIHAALAAVSAIVDSGEKPRRPIEVVALCEEEGSRFTSPMWGTQAILGRISDGQLDELVDEAGVSIGEAMESVGLPKDRIHEAARSDLGAFIELHIEQGGILEGDGVALGIVDAIAGQRHLNISVSGHQNHAGTTPMDLRFDALTCAAEMFLAIERIAGELGRPAVATVGQVTVEPGSRNVIPGMVTFTVDARHPEVALLNALTEEIEKSIEAIGRSRNVSVVTEEIFYREPTPMDRRLVAAIGNIASQHGVSAQLMPSGAGHDSQLFASAIPTAMLFTPSVGGISHSPLEFTHIDMIVPCTEVLAGLLWALAAEVGTESVLPH